MEMFTIPVVRGIKVYLRHMEGFTSGSFPQKGGPEPARKGKKRPYIRMPRAVPWKLINLSSC